MLRVHIARDVFRIAGLHFVWFFSCFFFFFWGGGGGVDVGSEILVRIGVPVQA